MELGNALYSTWKSQGRRKHHKRMIDYHFSTLMSSAVHCHHMTHRNLIERFSQF